MRDELEPVWIFRLLQPQAELANGQQWVTELSAPLQLSTTARTHAFDALAVTTYQFADPTSGVGLANWLDSQQLATSGNTATIPLNAALTAGPVQLHVWTSDNGALSRLPSSVHFNYVPANAPIAYDQTICYPFFAQLNDHIQIALNVPDGDNADLFVWYPRSFDQPNLRGTRVGDDEMLIAAAPLSGDYLLCVRGATVGGTTFTLTVAQNETPTFVHSTAHENDPAAPVPDKRYFLENPVPQLSATPTSVGLNSAEIHPPSITPFLLLFTATMLLLYLRLQKNNRILV